MPEYTAYPRQSLRLRTTTVIAPVLAAAALVVAVAVLVGFLASR